MRNYCFACTNLYKSCISYAIVLKDSYQNVYRQVTFLK